MKNICLLLIVLIFANCNSEKNHLNINGDPNNPIDVPIEMMMPNIMIGLTDNYKGSLMLFSNVLTQQIEGVARAHASLNNYTGLTPRRFDGLWQNYYENILNEVKIAKEKTVELELNHHLAILKSIEAFALMNLTDLFDNIPYSQALLGTNNFNPTYDNQSEIYTIIFENLEEALALIDGPEGTYGPGNEDVYYQGDMELWKKSINGLVARAHLHLGEFEQAFSAASKSYSSAADNWTFKYDGTANASAWWFRFNRDRTGDLEFHPGFRQLLASFNDEARLAIYDHPFEKNHPFFTADQEVEMITYREMEFIKAECLLRTGGSREEALEAYQNGIRSSFLELGIDESIAAQYIVQNIVSPNANLLNLGDVLTQKYLALFAEPEVYNDFRRTDIPNLSPVSGNAIPVRLDYPASEYLYNSNSPTEGSINIFADKVGWDE